MSHILRRSAAILVSLLILAAVNGCTARLQSAVYGKRTDMAQSEAVEWVPQFLLRIVKCAWEGPQLVVDVSLTYSGNEPKAPRIIPVFQLESADGKLYGASNAADATTPLLSSNYNPGTSRNVRFTFQAPHGDYSLLVEDGGEVVTFGLYPSVGRVVYVCHLQPSGG